jgi:hypothetical protein
MPLADQFAAAATGARTIAALDDGKGRSSTVSALKRLYDAGLVESVEGD